MKCKAFISGLIWLLTYSRVYGQHNFDSIKICHAKGELKIIAIGEYEVQMKEGQLFSFFSKDSAVYYNAKGKQLVVRNLTKGSSLVLQLSDDGAIVKARDTSLVLNSSKSLDHASSNDANDTEVLYSLGDFFFLIWFNSSGECEHRLFFSSSCFSI